MIHKYLLEPIPAFFHNHHTQSPFTTCTLCNGPLNSQPYVIEKHVKHHAHFKTNEIIYEYAVCNNCLHQKQSDISEKSLEQIKKLISEHQHIFFNKLGRLHEQKDYRLESWMETCSFTGIPMSECSNFSLSALIENHKLVFEQTPLMVSDVFQEKIQEVLSQETKDSFNGLRDKILDGSPGIEDFIGTPTAAII